MAQPLSPWLLVDRAGKNVRLPATMIFLGREDCDITIQVSYKHVHAHQIIKQAWHQNTLERVVSSEVQGKDRGSCWVHVCEIPWIRAK